MCVEGELLVLSFSSSLEMCYFLYAFENDFYSAAHSHNARFVPFWPAGHGSRSGGKRSTLVPCSVTRAQTDVTDALERTRESPRGRSARCGALITAHADAISWRARGHCLNRMEGERGEGARGASKTPDSFSEECNDVAPRAVCADARI